MENKQLATSLKYKFYSAFSSSAVLHRSETWSINKVLEKKLDRILCLSYMTNVTSQSTLNKTQMPAIGKKS